MHPRLHVKEKYVPKTEIEHRISQLQKSLQAKDIEAALVVYKMDYFYFSGTAQNVLLYVPQEGASLLMVFRDIDRAREESPLEHIIPLDSIGSLADVIRKYYGHIPHKIGMELDVLPVREYFHYKQLLSHVEIVDTSTLIKRIRMIKSPYELDQMRHAGEIGKRVYEEGCSVLREGMSEIEFGGYLELFAKRLEHEGLIRMRSLNYEAYTWHVLSGPNGSIVSQAESPMGGAGLSPAFPVGAGSRLMKAHEPILVDFGICYNGYLVDQTRMYCIGEMPEYYRAAYEATRTIERYIADHAQPGARCDQLFEETVRLAEQLGYRDSYLGIPGKQTTFVAHGIGLENSEIPYIAAGQQHALQEGMTIAVEPKLVFARQAAVGIEDTFLIKTGGAETLTPCDDRVLIAS